jgi:hypothetical protein
MVWNNADKRVDFLKRKKLKAERPRIITVFRAFLSFPEENLSSIIVPTDTLYAKGSGCTQAIAFS